MILSQYKDDIWNILCTGQSGISKKRQLPRGSKRGGGGGPVLRQLWAKLRYCNRARFSYYMYIVKYWQAKSPVAIVIALQMYCNTNIYKVSSDQSNRKIRPYLHTCMHRFKVTSLLIGVLLITTNEKCFIWLIVRFYSTLNINTWTPTHWHTHRNLISEWHIPPATICATEWKWRCSILTFLT